MFEVRVFEFVIDGWSFSRTGGRRYVECCLALLEQEFPSDGRRLFLHLSMDGFATEGGSAGDTLWTLSRRFLGAPCSLKMATKVAIARVNDTSGAALEITRAVSIIGMDLCEQQNETLIVCADHPALVSILGFQRFFDLGGYCAEFKLDHICVTTVYAGVSICRCQIFQDFAAHGLWCAAGALFKRLYLILLRTKNDCAAKFIVVVEKGGCVVTKEASGGKKNFCCKNNTVENLFGTTNSSRSLFGLLVNIFAQSADAGLVSTLLENFRIMVNVLRSLERATLEDVVAVKTAAVTFKEVWEVLFTGLALKRSTPYYVGQLDWAWHHVGRCSQFGIGSATVSQVYVEAQNDAARRTNVCQAAAGGAATAQVDDSRPLEAHLKKRKKELVRTVSLEPISPSVHFACLDSGFKCDQVEVRFVCSVS